MSKEKISEEFTTELFKARKKLDKVSVRWSLDDPVMLQAWLTMKKIPAPDQKTFGIDTRSTPPSIKFNPYFINTLSDERLECILSQETLKILLRHPTTRLAHPKQISSLASSITVSQTSMISLFAELDMDDYLPTVDNYDVESNQHFEKYFRVLNDKYDEVMDQIQKTFSKMSKEEKQSLEDAIDGLGEPSDGEGDEEGEGQGGSSKNGEGETDEQGYSKFSDEKDAIKEHLNPEGTNNKDWGENELLDEEIKNVVETARKNSESWGKNSGDFMDSIIAAHTPKISIREITRRFAQSVASRQTESSRMRRNRRYGLRYPGSLRKYTTKILFAVDSSGSMTEDQLADGFAIINAACKEAKISYLIFDTAIGDIQTDMRKVKQSFKVDKRGGTDFQCVVDYVNVNKYDGLVIFTDGYANAPEKPFKTKTLWLLTNKEEKPPVDWGLRAWLNQSNV